MTLKLSEWHGARSPGRRQVSYSYRNLKDEEGRLTGVSTSNLLIANSRNDLPLLAYDASSLTCFFLVLFNGFHVIDLTRVSQELAYLANDVDLVMLEGMVKHPEVAEFLGSCLYDCITKYDEALIQFIDAETTSSVRDALDGRSIPRQVVHFVLFPLFFNLVYNSSYSLIHHKFAESLVVWHVDTCFQPMEVLVTCEFHIPHIKI
ncbi:Hypothetical protein glysoja_037109 [Glycine soja]|uniref:Uncharacterized protein n=1 Tax=Glycine soja TaxID=3848 RepID=A0A0B2Q584_GLYSO|nr:Hypothetical protein glysoja_037109 [Glycine soja]